MTARSAARAPRLAAATILYLPPGASATALESKTNFFVAGRASLVRAEAAP